MEMCRVCLVTEEELQPLDENFIYQYNLLTNLSITLLDRLSQFSCNTCLQTVQYFIQFREKAIASETTLREIISSDIKLEVEHDSESQIDDTSVNSSKEVIIKTEVNEESDTDNLNVPDQLFDEVECDIPNDVKDEDEKPKRSKIPKRPKIPKKICKRKYNKKVKSKVIERNNQDSNNWLCGICPKGFNSEIDSNKHLDVHKSDKSCGICRETVTSQSELLAHRLKHVSNKQYKCHICGKRYRACLYLEYHYRTTHIDSDEPKLLCKICQATFSSPKRLQAHCLAIHSNEQYICDICSKICFNKNNIKSHLKLHFTVKDHVCDLCDYSSRYRNKVKEHKLRKHSKSREYCKNCTRVFSTRAEFDKHRCASRKKICPVCGVIVPGKLNAHLVSHSDNRIYACNRCPATFKVKSTLTTHINRHDGIRPYQCEHCPAKFYTRPVLIKHRRIHTGEKPFVCKVCNKGFTGRHNLRVHMQVHGEYLIVKKNTESAETNIRIRKD